MKSEHEVEAATSAPYLVGTVEEAWARCLPLWAPRGRVNDFPRAIRYTRYLPSFETILGRHFVDRFADEAAFLLERLRSGPEAEALHAFDLLDFLADHLAEEMRPLPDSLRHCDLPLPARVRREVAAESSYPDHGIETIGQLLSFDYDQRHSPD